MNEVRIHKTGAPDLIQSSDGRLTLSVPIQIKRRGGRNPFGETVRTLTVLTPATSTVAT
jgi:hypothetical protein